MFCSTCGKSVNQGLNYCNHCGARANGAKDRSLTKLSESSLNVLLGGIIGIPIAGLVFIIGLMSVMKKEMGFSIGLIIAFTFISFVLFLAAEAAFIWMLLQYRTKIIKETGGDAQVKEVVTRELGEPQARELAEPIPSVTENTTRSLEPMYREPNTR